MQTTVHAFYLRSPPRGDDSFRITITAIMITRSFQNSHRKMVIRIAMHTHTHLLNIVAVQSLYTGPANLVVAQSRKASSDRLLLEVEHSPTRASCKFDIFLQILRRAVVCDITYSSTYRHAVDTSCLVQAPGMHGHAPLENSRETGGYV